MIRKFPAESKRLCTMAYHAGEVEQAMNIAFYVNSYDMHAGLYHFDYAHGKFADLANAMGYDIVERPQSATVEAAE